MTSSRLRELSRLASPAPWSINIEDNTLLAGDDRRTIVGYPGGSFRNEYVHADYALIVALRNDAEKYADLRDAVKAYKKATDMRETLAAENNRSEYAVACVNETNAYRAMFAALAALGGEE